jgi:hypothetical protein
VVKALIVVALAGCNYLTDSFVINEFSGDPFPTTVDTTNGAIMLGAGVLGETTRTAVLDVLSPITLIDPGPGTTPSVDYPQLVLYGEPPGGGNFSIARAQLDQPQVVSLHPCNEPICTIGTPTAPRAFDAIVGVSAFSSDALRLHLAPDATTNTDQIFVLPDIGGDETHRSRACDAVFPSPFRGGGTLLVGGTELAFSNWRVAVDVCIAPDPDPFKLQSARGTDALLVASTALGVSLLDRSAYERFRALAPTAPSYDTLTDEVVLLPSGPITGRRTTLPAMALVAKSASNPRSPCRQVYTHHLMAQRDCMTGDDCPCTPDDPDNGLFCAVPAIVELTPPAGIDVLVVDDNDTTLQALRTELRPDQPEVDGILGADVMRMLEIDVDYPNGRLLQRCTADRATCLVRPELAKPQYRPPVNGCIGP